MRPTLVYSSIKVYCNTISLVAYEYRMSCTCCSVQRGSYGMHPLTNPLLHATHDATSPNDMFVQSASPIPARIARALAASYLREE